MTALHNVELTRWNAALPDDQRKDAANALESGRVLYFPKLAFALRPEEHSLLSPNVVTKNSKNASYDAKTDQLRGCDLSGEGYKILKAMMQRFSEQAHTLLKNTIPTYASSLVKARTSYRPVEIAGRATSDRKDDTLLHCDAFPSTPTGGDRILRVFANLNPNGQPRKWRVGTEPFVKTAERFSAQLKKPIWGSSHLMHLLGITRSRRSVYDHYMLQLHNLMKADASYQTSAPQERVDLSPQTTWIVYTDQTPHAVLAGQYVLEQTFYLPVSGMVNPDQSPLHVLEKLKG